MTPYALPPITPGIRAVPTADPTGGGLQAHRIQIADASGVYRETQLHLILHNSAGWKAYTGNGADAAAALGNTVEVYDDLATAVDTLLREHVAEVEDRDESED